MTQGRKGDYLGHTAQKRFGQNFLCDDQVISDIVDSINPKEGENLVEIGPGLCALTEPMCDRVSHLSVIEIDRDLAERLRHHPFIRDKLDIHETDALKFDFSTLAADESSLRVYGNLPYNISTPLIFHLLSFGKTIKDMHFMLQREVVDRIAAQPDSKDYGRLSVMVQYYCSTEKLLIVPPEAFRPAPKVYSAVVRLKPHDVKPFICSDEKLLSDVTAAAFGQRRKTISNSLKKYLSGEQLVSIGIDKTARAENLSVEEFVKITNAAHEALKDN